MSEVIVYQYGYPRKGSVSFGKKISRGKLFGKAITALSLVAFLMLVSPYLMIEAGWRLGLIGQPKRNFINQDSAFAKVIKKSNLSLLKPADEQFGLVIPKIGVNSTIIARVPVTNKQIFEKMIKKGVIHARGSYLPGEDGGIYLLGHSTNYLWNANRLNAIFYFLKELKLKDEINIFYRGERFVYRVSKKKIIDADDAGSLQAKAGEERLVLITCWPPGTTWKRLVVEAERI